MHVSEQKHTLRAAVEERLKRLSAADRAAESRSVCRRLFTLISGPTAVLAYAALPTEPDLTPLLQQLLERGDAVYLPLFERSRLGYRRITSWDELSPGPLGTLEPPASNPELAPEDAAVVLVPGRAFDGRGGRLGRGNGGFDRWIAEQRLANPATQYWGIGFECQLVSEVPMEPHDEPMDAVVTARG